MKRNIMWVKIHKVVRFLLEINDGLIVKEISPLYNIISSP